jgi:hypothetical protein
MKAMKTLKLVLIAALISTALVNSAYADDAHQISGKNVIKLTYLQAIQSPGLVAAMHAQLSGGFLGGPALTNITLRVVYQNHVYMITGTQDQWDLFFRCNGITEQPLNTKSSKTTKVINN